MQDTQDPKQRIMRTAADLFATRGYGVVGVREIAREANVKPRQLSPHLLKPWSALADQLWDQLPLPSKLP